MREKARSSTHDRITLWGPLVRKPCGHEFAGRLGLSLVVRRDSNPEPPKLKVRCAISDCAPYTTPRSSYRIGGSFSSLPSLIPIARYRNASAAWLAQSCSGRSRKVCRLASHSVR